MVAEKIYYTKINTPDGPTWAAASDRGLLQISNSKDKLFEEVDRRKIRPKFMEEPQRFKNLQEWYKAFYKGKPVQYNGPFDLRGTEFQRKVWKAIHDIPYGKLISYGQIAIDLGKPKASRAVGNAVGSNPLGPVIPCHRVVWSNGGIGGFSGGLEHKRKLLALEGILPKAEGTPEEGIDLRKFFIRKKVNCN